MDKKASEIMNERFGKDTLISLGTINGEYPAVRHVNAYYEDGVFYVITYALSDKMKQMEKKPNIALCGEWFTAKGKGENLGYFGKPENSELAEKLSRVFSSWIDNGHCNFDDENTVILKLVLEEGVLFSNGTRYDIDFKDTK